MNGLSWSYAISPMALLFWVPALALFAWWLKNRAAERNRRLDLLAQALAQPGLPPEVRAELLRVLKPPTGRLLVTVGWFGLVAGVTMWIWAFNIRWSVAPGIVTTIAGFALLALPVVWREVEGTRSTRPGS